MEAERIERTYSHYAAVYDLVFDRILQPGRRKSLEVLRPNADERVLEIGIGTRLSIPYYPTHSRITGIGSSFPPVAGCERLLRPLSRMLGFRLDLPLEVVSNHPRLEITRVRGTNLLGL